MEELRKRLDRAFRLLAAIPVSGDAVDALAAARAELRAAYQEAGEEGEDG